MFYAGISTPPFRPRHPPPRTTHCPPASSRSRASSDAGYPRPPVQSGSSMMYGYGDMILNPENSPSSDMCFIYYTTVINIVATSKN